MLRRKKRAHVYARVRACGGVRACVRACACVYECGSVFASCMLLCVHLIRVCRCACACVCVCVVLSALRFFFVSVGV